MAPRPLRYTKRDAVQALLAVKDAGLDAQRLEIDKDGKIIVQIGVLPSDICNGANDEDSGAWEKRLDELENNKHKDDQDE